MDGGARQPAPSGSPAAGLPSGAIIAAAVVLAVAALSRLFLVAELAERGWFLKYTALAATISEGQIPTERLTDVSPLYLWFVAFVSGTGLSARGIILLQGLMAVIAALLCGVVARRIGGAVAGFAAALFLILNRAVFVNASELEPETLILLLNVLALFCLVRTNVTARPGMLFWGGLALGASTVARPTALAVIAALGVWVTARTLRERSRWPPVAFFGGAAIPIFLAMAGNYAMTGNPSFMNPGTVFYEGMNPQATGYASGEPRIVSDLKSEFPDVDAVHVGYRVVAARTAGAPPSAGLANTFWTGRAIAYADSYPVEAGKLIVRKIAFLLHSFDAWDLSTMVRKDWAAAGWVWVPFGVLVALWIPLIAHRTRVPLIAPIVLYALAVSVAPVLFYVTSRQRNPLVPAAAILAAIGLGSIVRSSRPGTRIIAILAAATVGLLLTVNGRWQEETEYEWVATFASESLLADASNAAVSGDADAAEQARALATTWLSSDDPESWPDVSEASMAAAGTRVLQTEEADARRFDAALALIGAGRWEVAAAALEDLDAMGYRPLRRAAATPSVSYYRAVVAFRTGDATSGRALLDRAIAEAPADANVLALESVVSSSEAARARLDAIHDPFTGSLAMARAFDIIGARTEAVRELRALRVAFPLWNRSSGLLARIERAP